MKVHWPVTEATTLADIRADRESRFAVMRCREVMRYRQHVDGAAWADIIADAEDDVIDAANAVIALRSRPQEGGQ